MKLLCYLSDVKLQLWNLAKCVKKVNKLRLVVLHVFQNSCTWETAGQSDSYRMVVFRRCRFCISLLGLSASFQYVNIASFEV